jgi:hypothetical protein
MIAVQGHLPLITLKVLSAQKRCPTGSDERNEFVGLNSYSESDYDQDTPEEDSLSSSSDDQQILRQDVPVCSSVGPVSRPSLCQSPICQALTTSIHFLPTSTRTL